MMRFAAALLLLGLSAAPAFAHSAARGFVLLLPTNYVILGGALAVLASIALLSLRGRGLYPPAAPAAERALPGPLARGLSAASLALLVTLIVIGLTGPSDPLENLLTLSVWTLWWVVVVLLHPLFGHLWSWMNPAAVVVPLKPVLNWPQRLDYWPALAVFAAFAWFQLVYPAPQDPPRLAYAVAAYLAATLVATRLFGEAWLLRGDPFAVFLRQLAAAAPFRARGPLCTPGAGLLALPPLPLAGVLFVLLTLSSISFDGFANTFIWLSAAGINPLDYPGRTVMMGTNTLGLALSFVLLGGLFYASLALGWKLGGKPAPFRLLAGRLVFSLIPISIVYHLAHYLVDALLGLQYVALALNDPFEAGANILGLEGWHVTASFQNTASGALVLYAIQTAAIVIGHLIGIAVAHAMIRQEVPDRRAALLLELPLALLMVAYTAFGLWLLSAPSIA